MKHHVPTGRRLPTGDVECHEPGNVLSCGAVSVQQLGTKVKIWYSCTVWVSEINRFKKGEL